MERVYCGIDWAENHHDVALVDAEGNLVAKRRIADSAAGFADLTAMLADAGDSEDAPIPVAIETSRGLLVAALRAAGRPVYPINPMAVARYRERRSVAQQVISVVSNRRHGFLDPCHDRRALSRSASKDGITSYV